MNLFNQKYHIQIYMRRLQLEKKKNKKINKNVRCKKDSMERPLVNICMFLNFDNKFLVGICFKFLKLR